MTDINIAIREFDQGTDHSVIEQLYKVKEESPKLLRSKDFSLENEVTWTSWTMQEHVYKKNPSAFPTQARGLFTRKVDDKYTVAVRGYDKFFNLFETQDTQWADIEKKTEGPYQVTAKENGCIIFIAALSDNSVIVTSKHFIPSDKTDVTAHAGVGYNWLLEHLKTVNKTEKDMAEWLNEKNITLVAELCDDDFQQHILPYVDKARGLYLHGINYNTTTLYTLPSDTVDQVAASFGFHTIAFDTFETAKDVKAFGEKMQATGLYNGREIEGAVVRCKRLGMDFMFKIKNEQYLVYREYREVTKRLIDVKDGVVVINKEKEKTVKCTYEKTRYYIDWMRNQIDEHPDWFIEFKNEKGIIQVREAFEDYWKNGQLGNIGPITKAKK